MFVPASPSTLAPFPVQVHGMHWTLNPVVTVLRFLVNYKLLPTLSMDVVGRLPCFSPAQLLIRRAPRYIMCKQGGETGPGEGDLASPALSWQGSSTPPVRDLPRPDDHHQTTRRPEEDHQTTRSPPDYLNNFPKQLLEPLACGTLANMKTRLADKR